MGLLRGQALLRRVANVRKVNFWPSSRTYSEQISSCVASKAKLAGGRIETHLPFFSFCDPNAFFIARRFSAAVDVQQPPSETEVEQASSEKLSDVTALAVKPKKEKKEILPAEVAIPLFFARMKVVEQVVTVLKRSPWGEETEKALQALSLTYDTQLVTQVLRVSLPCDGALGFFNWLKKQKQFKHNEYTYGVLLNSLGRDKHITEMQEIVSEMRFEGCTITPVIISCAMHWYASVNDAPNVRRLWERLKREGTKPSVGIYTAYLDLLIRVKWFTKIPHVFERMLHEECLPNSRTYTLLIQHLADDGRLRAAVQILEIMQKVQVVPSRLSYEYIIEGYAKAGEVAKVQEFLTAMRERFHRPSRRLLGAVKLLLEAGKLEDAAVLKEEIGLKDNGDTEQVAGQEAEGGADDTSPSLEEGDSMLDSVMCAWRDVTSPNVGFDVNSFAQAIHTWSLAVEVELEKANVQWRSSLVLEVLRRLRNLETSWPFFHWVKNKAGFKHDKYTCMVMIQRILKSRSPLDKTAGLVHELFEVMQGDGINFTVPMFNMMIRHYVAAFDLDRALGMFNRIVDHDLEPNAVSYALIIQALAKDRQGRRTMEMLKHMQDAGFHLDSTTCAELITCLDLAEKLLDAYEVFCKIPESGRKPGPVEYKAIMAAYIRAGDQKMALSLYEQMRGAGIKPTQDMFDEVSVILKKANRQYDINTIAHVRRKLNFFGGRKKTLQEDLLKVLDLFMRAMKPRPNNAYASLRKLNGEAASVEASVAAAPNGVDGGSSVEVASDGPSEEDGGFSVVVASDGPDEEDSGSAVVVDHETNIAGDKQGS